MDRLDVGQERTNVVRGASVIETGTNEALLEERLTALEAAQAWSPRVVSKLEVLIRTADDYGLFRINPLRYGADQGADESEVIDLFLQATKVGLFDMDWLIVCGACANVFSSFRKLENLDPHFVCSLCLMDNEADLDDHIQVAFTVSPQVREIAFHDPTSLSVEDLYFRYHFSGDVKPLASGLTAPEVLKQWTKLLAYLEPGETESVELAQPRGIVGIVDVLSSTSALFVIDPGSDQKATELALELDGRELTDSGGRPLAPFPLEFPEGRSFYEADAEDRSPTADPDRSTSGGEDTNDDSPARSITFKFPAVGQLPPGPVSVSIHNASAGRTSVWVTDYPPVPDQAAFVEFLPVLSAKKLLSNQTFRRLFRSETAPASESLQVKDLTYLFTDLKDSTLMYDTVGDVNAYDLVRRHFDALVHAVAQNNGAVTKTIGDAVMATFVSPAHSVRAALDMQSAIAEFNKAITAELILKVGIHRGRSIAVTLNDRIDYFGQDVNIASRVQQLAGAGEIVLSADVYHQAEVAELLASFDVTEEAGIMKGVAEKIPVFRVRTLSD